MSSKSPDFRQRLAAANARIQYGSDERAAGADDKARAIADEAARRGRGGARQVADKLGVSEKTVSQAIARARRAPAPGRMLPTDTLDRMLAIELETLAPLHARQWKALAWLVRGVFIDISWIEQPGRLLAQEIEEAELGEALEPGALAQECRGWSRVQALAVLDACQRDDLTAFPTKEQQDL